MDLSEREREIARLRQVISRSQDAISALQKFVRMTEGKLRKIEGEAKMPHPVTMRLQDIEIPRLRMFQ